MTATSFSIIGSGTLVTIIPAFVSKPLLPVWADISPVPFPIELELVKGSMSLLLFIIFSSTIFLSSTTWVGFALLSLICLGEVYSGGLCNMIDILSSNGHAMI